MKTLACVALAALLVPLRANAQGGGMGMGPTAFGAPRFNTPEMPGAELDGPPESSAASGLFSLTPDQLTRYAQAYDSFMVATKPQRDSVRAQLDIMQEKLTAGDRAAALFYADRATKISKGLKDRQAKWEEGVLFKILSGDQVKNYKKWKKEQEDLADERQKRDSQRWNPMGSGMEAPVVDKSPVSALGVGTPTGTAAAVRVGRTVYVAGQVALDAQGNLVGEGDLHAQAVKAFANLTTVLQYARSRPFDVVRLTVYVVNYKPQDLALIREVGAAYLPTNNPPALTVLGVQSLYREGLLISVEATALVSASAAGRGGAGR